MSLPIIIRRDKKIFKDYTGLSVFIWIWIYEGRRWEKSIEKTIRHEKIHYKQQLELGFLIGGLAWAILMLISWIKHGKGAYINHPWEKEAYGNEHDLDYLKNRKFLAWIKYV